jgi:hypothetical protein
MVGAAVARNEVIEPVVFDFIKIKRVVDVCCGS